MAAGSTLDQIYTLVVTAGVELALWGGFLAYTLKKDNRQLRNGFLALLAASALFHLVTGLLALIPGLNILIPLTVLLALMGVSLMPLALMLNGVVLIRREGRRVSNLLSFGLGLALIGAPVVGLALAATLNPWLILLASLLFFTCVYLSTFLIILLGQTAVQRLWGGRRAMPHPDVIVVHGAGLIDGRVTPLLASRVRGGIEAWRAENELRPGVPLLIMSGGQGSDEPVSEASAMAEYAVEQGVAREQILLEDRSTTTRENIIYSRQMLMERGMEGARVLLVTSSYHAVRTAILASDMGVPWAVAPAKTAWYYTVNAWLREYVAVLTYRKTAAIICGVLAALFTAGFVTLIFLAGHPGTIS